MVRYRYLKYLLLLTGVMSYYQLYVLFNDVKRIDPEQFFLLENRAFDESHNSHVSSVNDQREVGRYEGNHTKEVAAAHSSAEVAIPSGQFINDSHSQDFDSAHRSGNITVIARNDIQGELVEKIQGLKNDVDVAKMKAWANDTPVQYIRKDPNLQDGVAVAKLVVPNNGNSTRCFRQIHLWAPSSGELGYRGGVHTLSCPASECSVRLVVDTSYETMQSSHAVILYHWTPWDWAAMHQHRPPGQKWVFYTLESPRHTKRRVVPPPEYYNTSYNYIMTYRYDSDVRADYGQYVHGKPEIGADDRRNWAENRTKLVAWMASNCGGTSWPRHDFVRKLNEYVKVDMYGKCGNLSCPKNKMCDAILRPYKFFLALENSECTDYITEKLWIQSYMRDLVPIVFGPPRSDYEKVAPPNSFIHIQDFSTIQELAQYIKLVDSNNTLYNTYFEWKKKGSLKPYKGVPSIMCQLLDRLLEGEKAEENGTNQPFKQRDWNVWWLQSCQRRGTIPQ